MIKQVLLAATALTLVVGATNFTQAADTPEDAERVATELNGAIADATPALGGDKRQIVIEPSTNPTVEIPVLAAPEAPATNTPVIANAGPAAAAPIVDLVPTTPAPDAGKPQILIAPAPNANAPTTPGVTANAPAQPALAPIHDGAELYRRLTAQGYRPLQLLETKGNVYSVLVADIYRTDVTYILAVDTVYGKVLSIRPVSTGNYGYGNAYGYTPPAPAYGYGYTAPAPTYGNTYTPPPANNYGGYAAPRTYTAPSYGYRY